MRCFKNIAQLIRAKRLQHPKGYSQSELSHLLGYKNGQFISNVERALCNIPLKMLVRVSDVLDIDAHELKEAILKDHEETLENHLQMANAKSARVQSLKDHNSKSPSSVSNEAKVAQPKYSDSFKLSSNS